MYSPGERHFDTFNPAVPQKDFENKTNIKLPKGEQDIPTIVVQGKINPHKELIKKPEGVKISESIDYTKREVKRQQFIEQIKNSSLNEDPYVRLVLEKLPIIGKNLEETRDFQEEYQATFLKNKNYEEILVKRANYERLRRGIDTLIQRFWRILPPDIHREVKALEQKIESSKSSDKRQLFRGELSAADTQEYIQALTDFSKGKETVYISAEKLYSGLKTMEAAIENVDRAILAIRNFTEKKVVPEGDRIERLIRDTEISYREAYEILTEQPIDSLHKQTYNEVGPLYEIFNNRLVYVDHQIAGAYVRLRALISDKQKRYYENLETSSESKEQSLEVPASFNTKIEHFLRTILNLERGDLQATDIRIGVLAVEMGKMQGMLKPLKQYRNELFELHEKKRRG